MWSSLSAAMTNGGAPEALSHSPSAEWQEKGMLLSTVPVAW